MVTHTDLLLERLQHIHDRAVELNSPRSFFQTLFEYIEVFDIEETLTPVNKLILELEAKDTAVLKELEKKSLEEMEVIYPKVLEYVVTEKIENKVTHDRLTEYQRYKDGTLKTSNPAPTEQFGNLSYALMTIVELSVPKHLEFVRQFGTISDEYRISEWTFSPSYHQWKEETERMSRFEKTKVWYSWEKIGRAYLLYRDYEKQRHELFDKREFWALYGISDMFQELQDVMDYRQDPKRYIREFDVGEYKTHLQRVHQFTKEKLLIPNEPNLITRSWSYDPSSGQLIINGQIVQFQKESFRAKLLELLSKNDKTKKKLWSNDEVFESIQGDSPSGKQDIRKVYEASKALNEYIASKSGQINFLTYDTKTVQISASFLK